MGAIQDRLNKFGTETVDIIQTNLASTGTNASGQTSSSLASVGGDNKVTVSGKAFIYVVETGRRPGRMPPVGAIMKWLQSGKVSFTGTIQSAAFAISRAIAQKGTTLFQIGGREDIITPAISDERIDTLTKDIADISLFKTVKVIENGIANSN